MGGCMSRDEISLPTDLIVDVQQIIADDVWQDFVQSSHRRCKFLRRFVKRSEYTVEVPMNYYLFQEVHQEFKRKSAMPSLHQGNVGPKSGGSSEAALRSRANPDQIGLQTRFKNDTDKDQTYNFRFEKMRKATVEVTYQKGFTIGGKANFSLGLPKVLNGGELSSEISMTYEVTSSKGQTFEESLTTEATSVILVSRFSRCTANVIMDERRLLADFNVTVNMSMPAGKSLVFIRDKQGKLVYLKRIENLAMLFPKHPAKDDSGKVRTDAVQFEICGVVDGHQLASHYIHLRSRKIPGAEKALKSGGAGDGCSVGLAVEEGQGVEDDQYDEDNFFSQDVANF